MAVKLQCPDNATLLRLFGQGGSHEEMDSLARHVEQCSPCGERIDEMLRKDELSLGLAKPVDGTDMPDSEALINLRRRLQQLRPPASSEKTADAIGVHSTSASGPSLPGTLPMSGADHGITFLAPPQLPDEIGRLGPYRVLKKLGAGGMGMVLLAEDSLLKRKVALKVMLPNIAVNPQARERFLREARAAAAIEHPHIITIHQVGDDNGVPFLAMPLLKGESLDDRLKREKKLPINEAVRITCEMADGLAAAHAQGLIHRDIKPGNVWLEEQAPRAPAPGAQAAPAARRPAKVKVLDFGLARSQADEVQITQSGAIVGTPAFMAPEQARGLHVDARADLFSLGCVLYVMLTGRRPFTGESTMALLSSLALDTPKSPREINPAVPAVLSDFTMRLLAKKPEERPASADAALDELRAMIRTAAAAKKAALSPHSAAMKTAIQPPSRLPAPSAVRPPPRRVALLVGLALLFVIGGGFAAYQLLFKTNDGILKVEVADDADVRFQNGELQIMDADGKLKYTIKPSETNKTLPPGKYLVKVVGADGLKMVSDRFEIIRGGTTSVRVTAAANEDKKSDPAVTTTPTVDDAWLKQVAALQADKQVEAVMVKMKELNPGFDGKMTPTIKDGEVTGLEFATGNITDVAPLRALPWLEIISCQGTKEKWGRLSDLTPLRNMKLTQLYVAATAVSDLSPLKDMKLKILMFGGTKVSDLSPLKDMELTILACHDTKIKDLSLLKGMKLTDLTCSDNEIADLSPLKGMKLTKLDLHWTQVTDLSPLKDMKLTSLEFHFTTVSDLSPLKGMPLQKLDCSHTRVTDLSPLEGMPLKNLICDFDPKRDADILRSIKTLETINGKPAAEFWKDVAVAAKQSVNDAWVKRVAALPADKQVEAVAAKLKEINPGFDGNMRPSIEGGKVVELWPTADKVTDVSPVRALAGLRVFSIGDTARWPEVTPLAPFVDLSPLKGMKLTRLHCGGTEVSDLSPLKGMSLTELSCGPSMVSDLSPLKDMKLGYLYFPGTKVSDLSPLKGMSLQRLDCSYTSVADLSPVKDMKLTSLTCGLSKVSDLSPLKGMPLTNLACGGGVSDLSPLKGMPLTHLDFAGATVSDLSPLKGMKLTYLYFYATPVADLSPLKGMPLTDLRFDATQVTDLSPLEGMPLKNLMCDFDPKRDAEILRSIKTLETINGKPAAEFWKDVDAAPKAPAKKDADADRKAAEYVLSIGGKVEVAVAVNDPYGETKAAAADLPQKPFRLMAVRLSENKLVSDAGLACFKDCKNVAVLDLRKTQVSDACLAHFKNCKNLRNLSLDGTQITNACLADLKDWKKLLFLGLGWTSVSNSGLVHLKDCKNLEQIFLGGGEINDASLSLFNCETLTALGLDGTNVSDEGLAYLKNNKIMYSLTLANMKVTDAGLENFKGLGALTILDLTGSKVTAAGVKKLAAALPKCKIKWDGGVIEPKP